MQKTLTINYQEHIDYTHFSDEDKALISAAYAISDKAYAPYSNFKVGAVLQLKNGEIITGNNQENIAYPSGLCAERTALFFAGANYPTETIGTLVVVAKGDLVKEDDCISPCGACRQVMVESENRQKSPIRVILVSMSGRTFVFEKCEDLLVFAFGMH